MIAKGFPPARVGDVARAFAAIPVIVCVAEDELVLRRVYLDTVEACAASGCPFCLRELARGHVEKGDDPT